MLKLKVQDENLRYGLLQTYGMFGPETPKSRYEAMAILLGVVQVLDLKKHGHEHWRGTPRSIKYLYQDAQRKYIKYSSPQQLKEET